MAKITGEVVEIFVPLEKELPIKEFRDEVIPIIEELDNYITWWSVLIHGHESGVPDYLPDLSYYHIRVKPKSKDIISDKLVNLTDKGKIRSEKHYRLTEIQNISGFDDEKDWEEIWDILGEYSKLFMRIARMYQNNIPFGEIWQWFHYMDNMFGTNNLDAMAEFTKLNNIHHELHETLNKIKNNWEDKANGKTKN